MNGFLGAKNSEHILWLNIFSDFSSIFGNIPKIVRNVYWPCPTDFMKHFPNIKFNRQETDLNKFEISLNYPVYIKI